MSNRSVCGYIRVEVYACSRKDILMEPEKSLDDYKIIAALLLDVQTSYGVVFNSKSRRLTLKRVERRLRAEGMGFLTKTLPRLGRAFDRACAGGTPLNATECGFTAMPDSQLPIFMGELISKVLQPDGTLLPLPCAQCVKAIRQILYLYYKYELPYSPTQEQEVIDSFTQTEQDLERVEESLSLDIWRLNGFREQHRRYQDLPDIRSKILYDAQGLLAELFKHFDPTDIDPKHGPGAVATKQRLWEKYMWTNVSGRITALYPYDAYFCASLGAVCDGYNAFTRITEADLPARVILVPKDSRGPRLISCEPVDFQWVQQGLAKAIVQLVEGHELTKFNVHFTDQSPNQRGAYLGSIPAWGYATLDLKEASDRVSLNLVRLLFPPRIVEYLEACRSLETTLPNGKQIKLRKFAPMGSSLCFPVMALTIWALLAASASNADARESILVYGDDVIVRTAEAENAITVLEAFGLKVNRAKSCTSGFFRESCGGDFFNGVNVTPIRFRTAWTSRPSADCYTSWIAYANSMWDNGLKNVYDELVGRLHGVYNTIPDDTIPVLGVPRLRLASLDAYRPIPRRWNSDLQKVEYYVRTVVSKPIRKKTDGWTSLLRYFAEHANALNRTSDRLYAPDSSSPLEVVEPFSVGLYTRRKASMLAFRWR